MERLEFDLLFRWFVGLGIDDVAWDQTSFGKNRDRLLAGDVAARFLAEVLADAKVKRLGGASKRTNQAGCAISVRFAAEGVAWSPAGIPLSSRFATAGR